VNYRGMYTDDEVHDSPKQTKAGMRRGVLDDLVAVCRIGLACDGQFDAQAIARLLEELDGLA